MSAPREQALYYKRSVHDALATGSSVFSGSLLLLEESAGVWRVGLDEVCQPECSAISLSSTLR